MAELKKELVIYHSHGLIKEEKMNVKLSKETVTLRDLSWGEELDCYEKADCGGGVIKNTILHREVELIMSGMDKKQIDSLSREDGKILRDAVVKQWKNKGDDQKK